MTTTNTTTQVRNYQGNNSFILKMKETLNKWGQLTPNQSAAVDKILSAPVEAKQVELTDDMKKVQSYEGENAFVKELQAKLEKYGKLTDKQVSAALKQIQKEEDQKKTRNFNINLIGETLKVGRKVGQGMKEAYGLEFNPVLLDITKLLAVSPKAIKFSGKMTTGRSKVCRCCAKTLTDEFSMLTGVGKTCANHMRIPYITDISQADRFREDYLRRVEEIGEMEFWVPKSQVKKWEGKTEVILKMI